MAEGSPAPVNAATPTIPQKRPLNLEDEQHIPAVSSPLNPDSTSGRTKKPPTREPREKKDTLKKREAKGGENVRSGTPDVSSHGKKSKKNTQGATVLSPIRYKLPPPKLSDFDPPREAIFVPAFEQAGRQFYECDEQYVCLAITCSY